MIEIKHKTTGQVLLRVDGDTLEGARLRAPELTDADLRRTNLRGVALRKARLDGACLQGANLEQALLPAASMIGSGLTAANLAGAFLPHADLCEAILVGANLRGTNLGGANLTGANLNDARFNRATDWPEGFDPGEHGAARLGEAAGAPIWPEYRVRLERVLPGEGAVAEEHPENLGKRTKLGGEPIWIQSDETPDCSRCDQPMLFVAQIDSIDYDGCGGDGPYMFGDVGMIYVFYCLHCGEVRALTQCY